MDHGNDRRLLLAGLGLAGAAMLTRAAKAGPLDPPQGAVTPTGKSLSEVFDKLSTTSNKVARTEVGCAEPRTPLESCAGTADAQFVITQPGAYCMTRDHTAVLGFACCVRIECDDVDLDCQGFSFRGAPGMNPQSCIVASGRSNIELYDACFTGWTGCCCDLGTCPSCFISDCTFRACACPADTTGQPGACCRVGAGSEVAECAVRQCTGATISCGPNSCITECCCVGGDGGAYRCAEACCIMDCDVIQHNGECFTCAGRCSVTDCRFLLCWGGACTGAGECVVCSNEFASCTSPAGQSPRALYIASPRCCIEDNSFSNCPSCVYIDVGGDGTLVDSNMMAHGSGGGSGGSIWIEATVRRCLCVCNCTQGYNPVDTAYSLGQSSYGPLVSCPPGDISAVPRSAHPWANLTC